MKKPAVLAILVALIISTNYGMLALPNVKLMDMLVFLAGFWLGPIYGAAAGGLSWMVYGTMNPLGFSLIAFLTVVPMEMLYGLVGGLVRKRHDGSTSSIVWTFVIVGLLTTFAYDMVTNAVTGFLFYESALVGLIAGSMFSIVHIVSNVVQFAVLAPLLVTKADRLIVGKFNRVGH